MNHAVIPNLAVNQKTAAGLLGISVNHFKQHVRPNLPVAYIGAERRFRVADLQAWLDRQVS